MRHICLCLSKKYKHTSASTSQRIQALPLPLPLKEYKLCLSKNTSNPLPPPLREYKHTRQTLCLHLSENTSTPGRQTHQTDDRHTDITT